mmetsp:Transcript_142662/g.371818  ORF Transcript_142662/g.371818 Transcript_142662/m.371818 type:complete len:559 (+) Transcript_142662:49-1725(+)
MSMILAAPSTRDADFKLVFAVAPPGSAWRSRWCEGIFEPVLAWSSRHASVTASSASVAVAGILLAGVQCRRSWPAARSRRRQSSRHRPRSLHVVPPSPPGELPVFGHLPLLGLGAIGVPGADPVHIALTRLASEHGDVMMLRFGVEDVAVLSSPESIKEALSTEAAAGRPVLPSMQANGLCQGLSAASPDKNWRALRSVILAEAFASSAVSRAQPLLQTHVAQLVERLRQHREKPILVRNEIRRAVTSFTLDWALSLAVESPQASDLAKLIDESWDVLTSPATTLADFTRTPGLTMLRRLRRKRSRLLRALIAGRRRAAANDARHDLLDALLRMQQRNGLSDALVESTLVELTTAGISTVATIIEWLLLLLAKDAQKQGGARRDVLGGGKIGYLDACIQETLRLKTPLFVPRRCLDDIQVRGWTIPAGTLLLPNSYGVAHEASLWRGASADEFRPERFLGPEAPLATHLPGVRLQCPYSDQSNSGGSKSAAAYKFLPFGVGARFCPGAPLALSEVREFAAALLSEFEWRPAGVVDLSEDYSLTLSPARPCPLVFTRYH